MSIEDYNNLLEKQDYKCIICNEETPNRNLYVDHCHDTNEIRGLLCRDCNLGLGYFNNPSILDSAKKYLENFIGRAEKK